MYVKEPLSLSKANLQYYNLHRIIANMYKMYKNKTIFNNICIVFPMSIRIDNASVCFKSFDPQRL